MWLVLWISCAGLEKAKNLTEWVSEWVSEWLSDWVKKWLLERLSPLKMTLYIFISKFEFITGTKCKTTLQNSGYWSFSENCQQSSKIAGKIDKIKGLLSLERCQAILRGTRALFSNFCLTTVNDINSLLVPVITAAPVCPFTNCFISNIQSIYILTNLM